MASIKNRIAKGKAKRKAAKEANKSRYFYQALWNKIRSQPKETQDAVTASGHADKDDKQK